MLSEICFKITLYRDSEAKSGWRYRLAVSQLIAEVAAAAAAKSRQSCLTLCDPTDGSPPGSPVPGILQARTQDWVKLMMGVRYLFSLLLQWLDFA